MIPEFEVNYKEHEIADKWMSEHNKVCENTMYTYHFTIGNIGTVVCVECEFCKEKIDCTDYDVW